MPKWKHRKVHNIFCTNKTENSNTITCIIKPIVTVRFISRSLSSLADNLSEELHKRKCKV